MGQNTEGALAAEKAPLRRAEKRKDMNDHILYNPLAGGGMIPTPQQDRLAQPKPLQIDGETIPEVRAYRAAVSTREC